MRHTARVFNTNRGQLVRLPAAYRFDAKEVSIRRDPTGDVILSCKRKPQSWGYVFGVLDKVGFSHDFPNRDLSLPQEREVF